MLDNTQTSNEIGDCVFWYKANVLPPFRMGSSRFWKYGMKMLLPDDDEDRDDPVVDTRRLKIQKMT